MNNETYRLPGPKGSWYLITFQPACTNCDGPSAISIEKFPDRKSLKEYCFEIPPMLLLEKWPCSLGTFIVTGHTKDEFVKEVAPHLEGMNPMEMSDGGKPLDKMAAEIIVEEMYDDSTVIPHLPHGGRKREKTKRIQKVGPEAT